MRLSSYGAHSTAQAWVGGYGAIMALAGACDAVALLNHPSSSDFSTDPAYKITYAVISHAGCSHAVFLFQKAE